MQHLLSVLMWNDSRNDTITGYRCAIGLSFCNGCIWVQMGTAGCKTSTVGATLGFRFAICCLAHVCPVSGFRLGLGIPRQAPEARTCGKQGLVWAMQKALSALCQSHGVNVTLLFCITTEFSLLSCFIYISSIQLVCNLSLCRVIIYIFIVLT